MNNYPANIEQKIDFTRLRQILTESCTSELGCEHVRQMEPTDNIDVIRRLLAETAELQSILEDASLDFPRGEIHDLRAEVARIRIEGVFLVEEELYNLGKTLTFALQLDTFFARLSEARFPVWSQRGHTDSAQALQTICRTIDGVLDRFGRLSDNASPELQRIRRELQRAQGSVARALGTILRQAQSDGLLDKDVTPTLREGRLVLPVPPAYKRKIGGIVHDESATGKTVFIEPAEVVEANNHIRQLEGEEKRERLRILQSVAATIRPLSDHILAAEQRLGLIDFVRAKVNLARSLKAIAPQLEPSPIIHWQQARHPILYLNFSEQGKTVVPLNIHLDTEQRVLVISGPNAGGKSVCLKTVALMQYMMQCGLLVPLAEDSRMGIFHQIMIDIGDEQSISDDLSTYSSHLRNMKAFVRQADEHSLLLIDEFGTGTEPLLGGAIAEAVLTRLCHQRAFAVITTHYTNLKHFAEQTPGVVNGAMLYDRGMFRPLFVLSVGQAGSSFAIEIARQIGLPDDIIAHATELVGSEHIDYDRQLQDIARDKRYWENKRQNIRQREKHLEEKIAYYEQEIAGLKVKRKQMLSEAKEEAQKILSDSNATIERTIREIKEAKADKQKTREARQKVEQMKQRVADPEPPKKEKTGKRVLHDLSELKPLSKQLPSQQPSVVDTIRKRKLNFSRNLDLRGMRVDEALEATIAYIDDAIMVAAGEVTILHGTGTGALKAIVRDYLATKNRHLQRRGEPLLRFHDGDPDRGGAGLTIVELP